MWGWRNLFLFIRVKTEVGMTDGFLWFLNFATRNRWQIGGVAEHEQTKCLTKKTKTAPSLSWDFGPRRWRCKLYVWQPKLHWSLTLKRSLQGTSIWVTRLQNGGEEKETVWEKDKLFLQQNNHKEPQHNTGNIFYVPPDNFISHLSFYIHRTQNESWRIKVIKAGNER